MRDMYKLVLLVPVVIILSIFLLRLNGGNDIDIAAGPGIQVTHQGEDFTIAAPGSAALQFSKNVLPQDPGTPTLSITSDPSIDVDLDLHGTESAQYHLEVDVPALQAAVGAAVETQVWDPTAQPPDYVPLRELRIDVQPPFVAGHTAYDDTEDEMVYTLQLDGGTAGQVITSTGPSSNPIYADAPTELPPGATDDQVLTWDAGASPAGPAWGNAPTGLPAPGTDGQVLTLVSGTADWADPTGGGQSGSTAANFNVYMGYTTSISPDTAESYRTVLESSDTLIQETETLAAIQRASLTAPQTSLATGYPLFAWPTTEGPPDDITSQIFLTPSFLTQASGTMDISGVEYEVWRIPNNQSLTFWEGTSIVFDWDLPAPVPSGGSDVAQQTANVTVTAAQIRTLDTTPVDLIASPGAGKYLVINQAWLIKAGTEAAVETPACPSSSPRTPTAGCIANASISVIFVGNQDTTGQPFHIYTDSIYRVFLGGFYNADDILSGEEYQYGEKIDGHGLYVDTPLQLGVWYNFSLSDNWSETAWDAFSASLTTATSLRFVIFYEIHDIPDLS